MKVGRAILLLAALLAAFMLGTLVAHRSSSSAPMGEPASRDVAAMAEAVEPLPAAPEPAARGTVDAATFSADDPGQAEGVVDLRESEADGGSKTSLVFGMPSLPEPPGGQIWRNFYAKYGELDQGEYARLTVVQRKFVHDLSLEIKNERLRANDYFPWSDTEVLPSDDELRELLAGPDARLSMGGSKSGIGRYYVVFDPKRDFDIYEAYWESVWLSAASQGVKYHEPE